MKNYPQIIRRVYGEPWLILPAAHRSIRQLLESKLEGADRSFAADQIVGHAEMKNDHGAAIINVHGVLGKHLSLMEEMCGGCSIDTISEELERAAENGNANRIILNFNTPGGVIPGIPELARKIEAIDKFKPVYGFTDYMSCSCGQWLMSQCREAWATPSAMVGSVGVYSIYLDESEALSKAGMKVEAIASDDDKLLGASFKPMTDRERGILQAKVDSIYAEFKAAIQTHRKVPDEYMTGLVYYGEEAVKGGLLSGLVDGFDEVIALTNK